MKLVVKLIHEWMAIIYHHGKTIKKNNKRIILFNTLLWPRTILIYVPLELILP